MTPLSPAIGIRESDDVILVVVEHRDDRLADHVNADRQAQELRLRPDVAVDTDPPVVTLRVERRNCEHKSRTHSYDIEHTKSGLTNDM